MALLLYALAINGTASTSNAVTVVPPFQCRSLANARGSALVRPRNKRHRSQLGRIFITAIIAQLSLSLLPLLGEKKTTVFQVVGKSIGKKGKESLSSKLIRHISPLQLVYVFRFWANFGIVLPWSPFAFFAFFLVFVLLFLIFDKIILILKLVLNLES